MAEEAVPTVEDVEELVCAATPHFAFQIRARVRDLVRHLPEEHPTRVFADEQMAALTRLGSATSMAAEGPIEPSTRPGWEFLRSHGAARVGAP